MTQLLICISLAIGTISLVVVRRKLTCTTLFAPWWWSLSALVAAAAVDLFAVWKWTGDDASTSALRYAARVLLLCPTISLIGAKRPQDGPWNFIVASLWGVLALPAAEALLLNTGQPLEVQGFRSWFVLLLVSISLINSLPTRHAFPTLLATSGQLLLLGEYLPWPLPQSAATTPFGFVLLALAAAILALQPPQSSAVTSLDRLWLDFRDYFGLFWGLRVQERLLSAAKMYDWPVTLHWTGWMKVDGQPLREELPPETQRAIMTTWRGLLRRFVTNDWIEKRLN